MLYNKYRNALRYLKSECANYKIILLSLLIIILSRPGTITVTTILTSKVIVQSKEGSKKVY